MLGFFISGSLPIDLRQDKSGLVYKYKIESSIEETKNEMFSKFENLRILELGPEVKSIGPKTFVNYKKD